MRENIDNRDIVHYNRLREEDSGIVSYKTSFWGNIFKEGNVLKKEIIPAADAWLA